MADVSAWFPAGLSQDDIDALLDAYPGDPHRAAADAWYDYAAGLDLPTEAGIVSVSTGAQSVTYAGAMTSVDSAIARGDWHLSRANARSVQVGPRVGRLRYGDVGAYLDEMDLYGAADEDGTLIDAGTITTADFPPIGGA